MAGKLAGVNKLHVSRPDTTDLSELEASIKQHGIQRPLVVDRDGLVLDGVRRLTVAKSLGMKDVPVIISQDYEQTMAHITETRKHGVAAVPMDHNRAHRLYRDTHLQVALRQMTSRALRTGLPRHSRSPKEGRLVDSRELLAQATGLTRAELQGGIQIIAVARNEVDPSSPHAKVALRKMDQGMSPASALNLFQRLVRQSRVASIDSLEEQRQVLKNAALNMGIASDTLGKVTAFHPKMSVEELEATLADFVKIKGALIVLTNMLRKTIKERA
jgi:ParB-like chromosome segregation protein Spo0J